MYEFSRDEVQILKAAWATDPGRVALTVIVERMSGLMSDTFDADPYTHARNSGRRSLGVDLMRAINLPIEKVAQEPHEPRSSRPITATERAERAASGEQHAATAVRATGRAGKR